MKLKLFTSGGTIDVQYNFLKSKVDYSTTHIQDMLQQGRARLDLDIEHLMSIDSRKITDEERQLLLEKCQSTDTDKIIITHGTDTMAETAHYLAGSLENKTVVLVGAMIPFAFKNSDALFNLGAAVSAVQLLGNGVYICMNGRVFSSDNVRKNFELGEFQTL